MRGRRHWVVPVLAASLFITACGTAPDTHSTKSSPASQCPKSPITGTCTADGPVLVVKIDDVREARPQFHLNEADIVLVEPVEGGLTRLFAVYNSTLPDIVGPIRSARITDTDLVPMFGTPLFAYSGSQQKLVPYLQAAPMQLVGAPQGGTGYRRLTDRPAPHNYVADVPELLTRVDDPSSARLSGGAYWSLGARQQKLDTSTVKAIVHWPASDKTFIWDAAHKYWTINVYEDKLMTQTDDAGSLERAHTANVVIMQSEMQASDFSDKFGATTPYPQTIGEGPGLVLRDGKATSVTWRRPTSRDLPRWFTSSGDEVALHPGNTWWLIVTDLGNVTLKAPLA